MQLTAFDVIIDVLRIFHDIEKNVNSKVYYSLYEKEGTKFKILVEITIKIVKYTHYTRW